MSKWRVGIYVRLSSEDKIKDGDESNSITNQKELIEYYLKNEKNIKIYDVYADDGYTGTDFNRPGFQRLKEDVYNGKVNTIIVKDLSRLGRDYLGVGELIETLIPKYNIRFISINERIDSYLRPDSIKSIEIPIKNLMNEGYSKDISYKIRSSLRISKESGNYIGNLPPYGYIKDILASDGEYQDAYILGINKPVEVFKGEVIAIIHRLNDVEDKLVVSIPSVEFSDKEIKELTNFIEQYFEIEIIR